MLYWQDDKRASRAVGETMSEERRQPEGRMKSVKKVVGVLFKSYCVHNFLFAHCFMQGFEHNLSDIVTIAAQVAPLHFFHPMQCQQYQDAPIYSLW